MPFCRCGGAFRRRFGRERWGVPRKRVQKVAVSDHPHEATLVFRQDGRVTAQAVRSGTNGICWTVRECRWWRGNGSGHLFPPACRWRSKNRPMFHSADIGGNIRVVTDPGRVWFEHHHVSPSVYVGLGCSGVGNVGTWFRKGWEWLVGTAWHPDCPRMRHR